MTTKINGGPEVGLWSEGEMHFFTITLPAGALAAATATVTVNHPQVAAQTVTTLIEVPNGTVSKVLDIITNGYEDLVGSDDYFFTANVVGLEYTEGTTTIKVALSRCGWTAANLQAALRELGAAVTVNKYTANTYALNIPVAITTAAVDFTTITVAAGASFTGSAT